MPAPPPAIKLVAAEAGFFPPGPLVDLADIVVLIWLFCLCVCVGGVQVLLPLFRKLSCNSCSDAVRFNSLLLLLPVARTSVCLGYVVNEKMREYP